MKALQMMRGICILAVIATHVRFDNSMIHANFIIQNIINVAVAGFVFLAGYFVNIDKALENPMRFVGRRFTRIMVPYFAWTFFWWAIDIFVGGGGTNIKENDKRTNDRQRSVVFLRGNLLSVRSNSAYIEIYG